MKLVTLFLLLLLPFNPNKKSSEIIGAWQGQSGDNTITMICSEKYFSATEYNTKSKKFVGTWGGSWRVDGNKFIEVQEFNTLDSDNIGKEIATEILTSDNQLSWKEKDKTDVWRRIDNGKPGKLAGAWLITARVSDGKMQPIIPGARRTMKILSGTRFQWIAYNVDTKEFFGTGGGTYTTTNNKYTEHIDFFSRDSSRVGKELEFNFDLKEGKWHHSGLSSKGDPIDEVWTKREQLGL